MGSIALMATDNQVIFSQIPLSELLEMFRAVVREELAAGHSSAVSSGYNNKPLTTKELCEHLRVSEPTIIRWRKKKVIPYFTIGTAVRYHLNEVIAALEAKKENKGKKLHAA